MSEVEGKGCIGVQRRALLFLSRKLTFVLLFFEGGFGGAVNPTGVKIGFEGKLPAGLWANGMDGAGLFVIGAIHKKGAGSPFLRFRYPGFAVFAEAAIIPFNYFINGKA
jgi:hypothetical protein